MILGRNNGDYPKDQDGWLWVCGRCNVTTQGGGAGLEAHHAVVHESDSMALKLCSNDSPNDSLNTSNDESKG